jgi:lysine 2,3-aminomutase
LKSSRKASKNENNYLFPAYYSTWLDDLFTYQLRIYDNLNGFLKLFWDVCLWGPINCWNRHLGQKKIMTWQEDMRTALKSAEDLKIFFDCEIPATPYSIFLPRTFAEKIKKGGPNSPLWKQFVPQIEENSPEGLLDPIGDKIYLKAPQIIHRYKNRALFLPTTNCPVVCRYCFRKNELSFSQDLFLPRFNETLNYLRNNPQIEELIFSGGDPLILSDEKLSYYLSEFKKIPSLKFIRLHTRTPIILPSRITDNFISVLKNNSCKSFR